jgi:hypothetical protein
MGGEDGVKGNHRKRNHQARSDDNTIIRQSEERNNEKRKRNRQPIDEEPKWNQKAKTLTSNHQQHSPRPQQRVHSPPFSSSPQQSASGNVHVPGLPGNRSNQVIQINQVPRNTTWSHEVSFLIPGQIQTGQSSFQVGSSGMLELSDCCSVNGAHSEYC